MDEIQHLHFHGTQPAPDGLLAFFHRLFELYTPRQQCMFYETDVIWLHVLSDALIAISYYSIPIALFYFARRRRDLSYRWMFLMFAAFILSCGTTHLIGVLDIWRPYYRLDGLMKLITALVSMATAVMLWPLIPRALALPSPTLMRETNLQLQREVTERRQVQEELRRSYDELERRVEERTAELAESEARMRAIIGTAADGIVLTDAAGTIEAFNAAAEQIFGYPAAEVIGGNIQLLLAGPYRALLDSSFGKRDHAGAPGHEVCAFANTPNANRYQEVQGLRRDGSPVPLELALSQTSLDARRKFIAIVRDITERKRAEAALREADRRKDDFLAMLAHELRNPLAPVRNAAYVIGMHGSEAPLLRRQAEIIERQIGHMTRLIDDLLDVSRITRGKVELKKEPVALQQILRHAVEEVLPFINRLEHRLEVVLPEYPIQVDADPVRLQQVFSNLLNNAAKYMDPGGLIEMRADDLDGCAVVIIRDHGIGITPEVLPHIFELFVQDDKSLARSRGGLGIGLTLVRMLIERHGGRVEARSDGPGQGAEFIVHLPVLGLTSP